QGVAAVDAPAHIQQPQLAAQQVVHPPRLRIRRPEHARDEADGAADRALGPGELTPGVATGQGPEVRVAPGVVDELTDPGRGARPRSPGADTVADLEERRTPMP